MKRLSIVCLILGLLAVVAVPAWAATSAAKAEPAPAADKSPIGAISKTVATVTGIAISPLLGTGALGVYERFTAKTDAEKAKLLFPKAEAPVLSAAIVPLEKEKNLGLLALGSRELERFQPRQGKLFLEMTAELVSAALRARLG